MGKVGIKPGFDPDLAREILGELRTAAATRDSGGMLLARRYVRNDEYLADRMVVWELVREGYSAHEIVTRFAEKVGRKITLQKVDALIRSAVHDTHSRTIEEMRAIENARLDLYLVALQVRIGLGDEKAINTAVMISKRRSALNGLDAPVRVHAHVSSDIDPALLEQAEEARKIAAEAIAARFPQGIEDAEEVEDADGAIDVDFAADVPEEDL